MDAQEVIDRALVELAEFFEPATLSTTVMLNQLSIRQQHVFAAIAQVDEEYFGHCAIGTPDSNYLVDLEDMTGSGSVPPAAERITRIRISDVGTSDYTAGEDVHIIRVGDEDAADAPRCYLRDQIIQGYDDDLDGVAKLEVFYSRRPVAVTQASTTIDLDDPYSLLLVYDLARFLASRTRGSVTPAQRAEAVEYFQAREGEVMELLEAHVQGYASGRESRHD